LATTSSQGESNKDSLTIITY